MKLIYAIIRYDNEDDVTTSLTKHKFSVTRLSTTGGFLKKGNTTLMIVTEPERVDEAIDIIKKECGRAGSKTGKRRKTDKSWKTSENTCGVGKRAGIKGIFREMWNF